MIVLLLRFTAFKKKKIVVNIKITGIEKKSINNLKKTVFQWTFFDITVRKKGEDEIQEEKMGIYQIKRRHVNKCRGEKESNGYHE